MNFEIILQGNVEDSYWIKLSRDIPASRGTGEADGDRRQWILGQYATLVTAKGMEAATYPEEGMVRRFGDYIPVRAKSGVIDPAYNYLTFF